MCIVYVESLRVHCSCARELVDRCVDVPDEPRSHATAARQKYLHSAYIRNSSLCMYSTVRVPNADSRTNR